MSRKTVTVTLLLVFISIGLFATTPESWVNSSFVYDIPYKSGLTLSSGQEDAIGYDFSWFAFPRNSDIGLETKFAMSFSLDANPAFLRLFLFTGPTFTSVLAGGVTGFLSVGPFYALTGTDTATSILEQQLGAAVDLGARFRFAGNEIWDFALILGTFADLAFLHIVDETRVSGLSGSILPYIGFSFGSAFNWRYTRYYPRYSVYSPVLYF
ncbi:hypothetical protein SpiGrapes_1366 [Sphaerochaeta pleomorpha str. Grapes]|uniref:Outer membrane protein beta-barrel domain-containing protein n=1 Tax=Sphaerochaeta pleomorpha (strain ATCC BAA-1885 / DSM 22778 / Grapes) TaxID=158190 RepID=G8QUE6_SPHPG|nr:hypothetical protein [Sphaerochaeta pleomorpha]AEV29179.1 hypothetical protein SpiGrapes_1366 [Sphaerochaeta pleomorpha str. Grapes]